jgi:hypothetical protein
MLEESRCPPDQQYLMIIGRYSQAATAKALAAVRAYYDRERHRFADVAASVTEEFLAFADSFNGVVLQTCYCHADVARGRSYDMVFDMQRPDRFEFTRAVAQYHVIWGQVASAGLTHGWHQAAFFEFPGGVPELVRSLPVDDFAAQPLVAVCDSVNWEVIAQELERSRRTKRSDPAGG